VNTNPTPEMMVSNNTSSEFYTRKNYKHMKQFADCGEIMKQCKHSIHNACNGGAIYGLGFIGAIIYYISTATGFWNGVLGVLKAIVWPVFLVYSTMKFLGM
jgi:hypothetical protein